MGAVGKWGQAAQRQALMSRMGDLFTDPWEGELKGPQCAPSRGYGKKAMN